MANAPSVSSSQDPSYDLLASFPPQSAAPAANSAPASDAALASSPAPASDAAPAGTFFVVNAVPALSGCSATPAVTVNVCAQYTRQDWHWVAMKRAFGESTARAIRDKKAWLVGRGASFHTNRSIIQAVYDYYGVIHKISPDKCLWAGLGRVAGGPFFRGFDFIDTWIRGIEADPCFGPPDSWIKALICSCGANSGAILPNAASADGGRAINLAIHATLQTAIEALMSMGRLIFEDLAWQHEAYLAGGLSEILRLGGTPGVFDSIKPWQDRCLGAWRDIDQGRTGAIRGNCTLFQREQLRTIPPGYKALNALLGVPTVMSFLANSPHPWGKNFFDYWEMTGVKVPSWGGDPNAELPSGQTYIGSVFEHDVTDDNDRWSWMQNNIYPTWMSTSDDNRKKMVNLTLKQLCDRDWKGI